MELDRVYDALRKADAAGNTEDAKKLADYIRSVYAQAEQQESGEAQPSRLDQALEEPSEPGALTKAASFTSGAANVIPGISEVTAGTKAIGRTIGAAIAGTRPDIGLDSGPDVSLGDVYRYELEQIQGRRAQAEEAAPGYATAGTVAGIGAGIGPEAIKGIASAGRGLLTKEGLRTAVAAVPGAFSGEGLREGIKAGLKGGATGAVYGLDAAETEIAQGDFIGAGERAIEGAAYGSLFSAPLGALGGGARRSLLARGEKADDAVEQLTNLEKYEEDIAAVPAKRAAAKAEAAAANEQAKLDAISRTKAKQEALDAAAASPTAEKAVVLTGLDGLGRRFKNSKELRKAADEIYNEPLPGDPSKSLLQESLKLPPQERLELATRLRNEVGAKLGGIRDQLAQVEGASVSAADVSRQLRDSLVDLPSEVQAKALKRLDDLIGAAGAKDGLLDPRALRKLAKDSESLSKFGDDVDFGKSAAYVYRQLYFAATGAEKYLVGVSLPKKTAEAYAEALRQYRVFKNFEEGSNVIDKRAAKLLKPLRLPSAPKAEKERPFKVQPQEVPEPEFPGGPEAEQRARNLLGPTVGQEAVSLGSRVTGSLLGGKFGGPLGSAAGSAAGQKLSVRWRDALAPSKEKFQKQSAAIKRLKPVMEEALRQGPAAVALAHAILSKDPEYRKVLEQD